jgi:hypothetical protein
MRVKMIKAGSIDGVLKNPGDVIDVDNYLGPRLIEFGYAREYKEKPKTAEEKIPKKTADRKPSRTAEKKSPGRKTAAEDE